MAITRPLPSRAPTRAAATWLQPPGAAPRSMMRCARLEQLVLVVDLDELISRARPVAFAARLGDIGVVELAFEPAGGGWRTLAGRLDPGLERSAALAARAARRHQRSRGRRCGPTPSARIM